jgi:hypothetical protein
MKQAMDDKVTLTDFQSAFKDIKTIQCGLLGLTANMVKSWFAAIKFAVYEHMNNLLLNAQSHHG